MREILFINIGSQIERKKCLGPSCKDYSLGHFHVQYSPNVEHLSSDFFELFTIGELFGVDRKILLDNNLEELSQLNLRGSYLIIQIDKSNLTIAILTDLTNSRKAFLSIKDDEKSISTSLKYLKDDSLNLDMAGIGSYLANGIIYNNKTVYKEISVLDKSSLHIISKNGHLKSHKYWTYQFNNSHRYKDEIELVNAFGELLIDNIDQRTSFYDKHYVSISGGYDSAGIAGILNILGKKNVETFSYIYGDAKPGSDAFVARKMSELSGYKHHVVQSYNKDLLSTITLNAEINEGMSNFCDEIDIWNTLPSALSFENANLFAGDMYYLPNVEPQSEKDAVSAVGINHSTILSSYSKYFEKNKYKAIVQAWQNEFDRIINDLPEYRNFKDLKDQMYFNYRIPNTLMNWREFIQMSFLPVSNPFLDRSILDFVSGLSTEQRDKKTLYKKSLKQLLPKHFAVKRATENRVKPNWKKEFTLHEDALIKHVTKTDSHLDKIISKSKMIACIKDNKTSSQSISYLFGRAARSIRYRYPVTNKFISKYVPIPDKTLDNVLMLKRLLVLRMYLKS